MADGATSAADGPATCVFCAIAAGEAESSTVYEDETVLVFMALLPATPGHVLVVPRRHAVGLDDLDGDTGGHVWTVAQTMAGALRASGMRPAGINLLLCDGVAAFQTVFHVHLHVIPRYVDDGWTLTAEHGDDRPRAQLELDAEVIRRALRSAR